MMMALGRFSFSLRTLPYQSAQHAREWRHVDNTRIGERAASQFIGPGTDKITLAGLLVPEFSSGRFSLDVLVVMAASGQAYSLVDGLGRVHGAFVIEFFTEDHSYFTQYGSAQRIEFTLALKRVDDMLI